MKQKTGLLRECRLMTGHSPLAARALWLAIALCCCGNLAFAMEEQNKKESRPPETQELTLSNEDTVESLSAALKGSRGERLVAIRKLGMIGNKESKDILFGYYQSLPQARSSTGAQQTEKVLVVKELANTMDPSEIVPFLLDVLNIEIKNIREAKKIERDIYYPEDLIVSVLSLLDKQGINRDIRKKLGEYTSDQALPTDVRSEVMARTMRFDLEEKGLKSDHDKARFVIEQIVPRPVAPIPWNIHTNQEMRINYGKTEAVQKRSKEAGVWYRSDRGVENSAHEILLRRFGLAGVMALVEGLEDKTFDTEKKDYLAVLATRVLRKYLQGGKTISEADRKELAIIRKYLGTMKDEGAFCRRSDVAANLNVIYAALGMAERVPITPEDRIKLSGQPKKE